ncbi:SLC13 family permease, partial [bacterium]
LPAGMPKFGLLELTPIGLALVIGGLLYLVTGGKFLLSRLSASRATTSAPVLEGGGSDPFSSYQGVSGPYVLVVPEGYDSSSGLQTVVEIRRRRQVNIVAVIHSDGTRDDAPAPNTRLMAGMTLCTFGAAGRVRHFAREYGLELQERSTLFRDLLNPAVAGEVEIVVSPRSSFIGRTIKEIRFRENFGLSPLALHHDGVTFYLELADRPLRSGDVILAFGTWERVHALREYHQNFIFVCPSEEECETPRKMKPALICFLSTLGLMLISSFVFQGRAYNPIPLSVCLMAGAVGMIVTGVVSVGEAYRAVDWRTVFLLGGLIPLGMAVDQTGTAEWIARGIVTGLGSSMTPLLLLIVLATLSCAFTLVISNVGACTLLVPLGISIATRIGVDPRVAAIVVGLGVSNSFILPTHQVNALYMGPGEYRTKDYVKIGGILSVIYMVILVAMTYWFYL